MMRAAAGSIEFAARRRASVLILVLWMVIILGTMGLSYTFSVRTQAQIAQSSRNRKEAYWAARAGVEKARAILALTDLSTVTSETSPCNDPAAFWDQPIGDARYFVWVYDEASRVNVNGAEFDTLMKLPAMSVERAQSLIDWRDSDRRARSGGAEDSYYLSLVPPYRARNAPLLSMRELERVRGWNTVFRAAFPDPFAGLSEEPEPMDDEGIVDEVLADDARRLLGGITVWSVSSDFAPDAEAKMDMNQATASQMRRRITDLADDEANAIVEYRKTKSFKDVFDLLDVTAAAGTIKTRAAPTSSSRSSSSSGSSSSSSSSNRGSSSSARPTPTPIPSGPVKVFTLERAGPMMDYFTSGSGSSSSGGSAAPGLININTAGTDALMTLPEMTEELANAITEQRISQPFVSPGAVAALTGMTEAIFKKIYPMITTRSTRYHVTSVGHSADWGANVHGAVTIEGVIAVENNVADIIYWREN